MKYIIPVDGQWVGPPVLVLILSNKEEMIIDGRKRLRDVEIRGLRTHVPRQIVRSHIEAVKALILNHHMNRAAQHAITCAPEFVDRMTTIEELTHIQRGLFKQALDKALNRPKFNTKATVNKTRVLNRALEVWEKTQEGSPLKIKDLAWILEGAIDD